MRFETRNSLAAYAAAGGGGYDVQWVHAHGYMFDIKKARVRPAQFVP